MHSIHPEDGQCHHYFVDSARALHRVMVEEDIKGDWLAAVLEIDAAILSKYRSGERPIPLYRAALIDEAIGRPVLLGCMARMEGHTVITSKATNVKPLNLNATVSVLAGQAGKAVQQLVQSLDDTVWTAEEKRRDLPCLRALANTLNRLLDEAEAAQ